MNIKLEITKGQVEKVGNRYYIELSTTNGLDTELLANLTRDTKKDCEGFAKEVCILPLYAELYRLLNPKEINDARTWLAYSAIRQAKDSK